MGEQQHNRFLGYLLSPVYSVKPRLAIRQSHKRSLQGRRDAQMVVENGNMAILGELMYARRQDEQEPHVEEVPGELGPCDDMGHWLQLANEEVLQQLQDLDTCIHG